MSEAKRKAENGIAEGTVIVADEQLEGRGRYSRKWVSAPDSSLLLSIILYPHLSDVFQMNMAASLAVVQSIEKTAHLSSVIKWPNDVLINGKKVCGILIENVFLGKTIKATIVGIGLNVNLDPSQFPEISTLATSLSIEAGRDFSRQEVLRVLLQEFENLYLLLHQGESLHELWITHVETLGKSIRLQRGDTIEEGFVEVINPDGSLVLRHPDGTLTTVVDGEVTLSI